MVKTKKNGKRFGGFGKRQYLCTRNKAISRKHRNIGIWCNGNTADSGPAFPGSSPGIPTKRERNLRVALFLFEEIKRDVLPKIPYITLKNIFI